MKEFTC